MTTGTLALIITLAILAQVVLGISLTLRRKHKALGDADASASAGGEPVAERASTGEHAAWDGLRSFRVVKRVPENLAGDVVSFYLEPEQPMTLPPFQPGQFLTLRVDLPGDGGGEAAKTSRCYSLSDRPRPDGYRISVKRQPNGRVSNHLHDHVAAGDTLMVKAPSGHFHLDASSPLPLVLIAGGIGITPMLSMLNSLLASGSDREIWLFYGVRNGREAVMHERLRELAGTHPQFHLHLCFSRPDASDKAGIDFQHTGRVDVALLQRTLGLGRYAFYVCGPAPLMESIVPGLESLGIDAQDIHYEAFGPSSLHRPAKRPEAASASDGDHWQVVFGKSGKSARWSNAFGSLLELVEAEGVAVDSACRSGSCGSCQTRIEQGEVAYEREPDAEVEAGHCLLCVSRPKSDLSLAL